MQTALAPRKEEEGSRGSRCLSWDPGRLLDSGTGEGSAPGPVFLGPSQWAGAAPLAAAVLGDGADRGAGGRQPPSLPALIPLPSWHVHIHKYLSNTY